MKIITVDGIEWDVKYQKNRESISFDVGTTVSNYPDFVGSQLRQNSSGSNKFNLTFAVHKTELIAFITSFKKFVSDVNSPDIVIHPTYGKLTHIILEHKDWGAIKGGLISEPSIGSSSEADILINCQFQEHTDDTTTVKRDFENENETSDSSVDSITSNNFDVGLSGNDKSILEIISSSLNALYRDIQNSNVVNAFNDFNAELDKAILESQKIMNTAKKIINLPNKIFTDTVRQIEFFNKQANVIKNTKITSYNIALFNVNLLAFNTSSASRVPFILESAQQQAAGIKTVAL